MEETGFHFPRPGREPRHRPGHPCTHQHRGRTRRQGSPAPTRAAASPGRIRPLARGRNNFGTAFGPRAAFWGRLGASLDAGPHSFIAMGLLRLAMGRVWGSCPAVDRVWGSSSTVTPTGSCLAWGLRAPALPGTGIILPRLRLWLAARLPALPSPHRASMGAGSRVLGGAGGRPPSILPFAGSSALLPPTGTSPVCTSSPHAEGCEGCGWCTGGVGGALGAPGQH